MCHIFVEQVMITLVTFYAPWYLLALKRLCEWLLEISDYFNNHLILSSFLSFFDVSPSIRETQKSFKHKPFFSLEL